MATTAGIYLTHESLDLGPEFEAKVWASALGPGELPTPMASGAPMALMHRNGSVFGVYLLPSFGESDPAIAKAKAVLVVSGMPTDERVGLARDLGERLTRMGFGIIIDDEAIGFLGAE